MIENCEVCHSTESVIEVKALGLSLCFNCRVRVMSPKTSSVVDMPVNGVKLEKNSKGYNWEIKLAGIDLVELERINTELLNRFGGG